MEKSSRPGRRLREERHRKDHVARERSALRVSGRLKGSLHSENILAAHFL